MSEFKDILNLLRKEKGVSQEIAAKGIGITRGSLANYESGHRKPRDYEVLEAIADYYNVNISLLISSKDPVLDEKEKPAPVRDELHNELYQEVLSMLLQLPAEDVPLVEAYIQGLRARREG